MGSEASVGMPYTGQGVCIREYGGGERKGGLEYGMSGFAGGCTEYRFSLHEPREDGRQPTGQRQEGPPDIWVGASAIFVHGWKWRAERQGRGLLEKFD
ncbi:hypothetical protein MGYG_05564 [Nannizzia gypsea CBS 118893]|uniref:Uncharacterized protein n=1 Tax=Arthroderma gypseum (strain ATCC MYA-4604 / CBS 118893) TaxID=535722 RepID=E4UWM5_ARTGP|nr:hypothetical protein MGYG_05564 [Nannizzia gypsea CBS 118893]EFR02568.1 hypothetical protein MGYG_05564 [Nannizzia gypsea CBS 118893]